MVKCSCSLFLSCKNYKLLLASLQNFLKFKAKIHSIIATIHSQFQPTNLQTPQHFHIAAKTTTARVGVAIMMFTMNTNYQTKTTTINSPSIKTIKIE